MCSAACHLTHHSLKLLLFLSLTNAAKRQAVQHAAQESQLSQQQYRETQQALAANANGSTSTSNPSPSTVAYANSYHPDASSSSTHPTPLHPQQSSNPSSSNGYNPATGLGGFTPAAAGSAGGSSDDAETKYTIYRQWLDETKGKGKSSNVSSMSTSRGHASGELHHTLLEDEDKKMSVWEKTFGGCCPSWCFR